MKGGLRFAPRKLTDALIAVFVGLREIHLEDALKERWVSPTLPDSSSSDLVGLGLTRFRRLSSRPVRHG